MIESVQNKKIKLARSLSRRRSREREGKLFVEGVRLVQDALDAGIDPQLLFYTGGAYRQAPVQAIVARWREVAWEVSEPVMQEMAETVTPQGIAAILPLPELPWPQTPDLLLVVDQLRDPGNLGTLIRAAAAAGVQGILALKGTVDPWGDKVLRAAMGAHFRIPVRGGVPWTEVAPLLDGLAVRLADMQGEVRYDEADWTVPAALIVGGEAGGASGVAAQRADDLVSIPMARAVESLNAAVAGSVIIFEALRQRRSQVKGD